MHHAELRKRFWITIAIIFLVSVMFIWSTTFLVYRYRSTFLNITFNAQLSDLHFSGKEPLLYWKDDSINKLMRIDGTVIREGKTLTVLPAAQKRLGQHLFIEYQKNDQPDNRWVFEEWVDGSFQERPLPEELQTVPIDRIELPRTEQYLLVAAQQRWFILNNETGKWLPNIFEWLPEEYQKDNLSLELWFGWKQGRENTFLVLIRDIESDIESQIIARFDYMPETDTWQQTAYTQDDWKDFQDLYAADQYWVPLLPFSEYQLGPLGKPTFLERLSSPCYKESIGDFIFSSTPPLFKTQHLGVKNEKTNETKEITSWHALQSCPYIDVQQWGNDGKYAIKIENTINIYDANTGQFAKFTDFRPISVDVIESHAFQLITTP